MRFYLWLASLVGGDVDHGGRGRHDDGVGGGSHMAVTPLSSHAEMVRVKKKDLAGEKNIEIEAFKENSRIFGDKKIDKYPNLAIKS